MPTLRESLCCPECQHRVFWRVPHMRERAGLQIVDMALYHSRDNQLIVGYLESLICAACGRLEWHVSDLDALKAVGEVGIEGVTETRGPRCAGCATETPRIYLETVWEEGGIWFKPTPMTVYRKHWAANSEGHFSASVCSVCALVEWQAHGLESLEQRLPRVATSPAPHARRCDGCGHERVLLIPRLYDEAAHYNWPVKRMASYVESRWGGVQGKAPLSLEVCLGCRHALFRTQEVGELRESPADGVTRIDATQMPPGATPYRGERA